MLLIARSRTLALVAVPVLAAAGTAAGVVLTDTSAHAAGTGFTYAVGINTGTQTISLTHLKTAVVQHNLLAVANTMTSDEAALATTDLGGPAKVGFDVTKVFDNSDAAASVASLVQTSVTNAGLWTYYNGTLCDHIQARPVFVASVDHPTVQSNSTTSVTETVQFVGRSFIQIVPNTCPTEPAIPTTGTYYLASITTTSGTTYSFSSIHSFTWAQSEKETSDSVTTAEQSGYTQSTGKAAVQEVTFTHGLDTPDEKLGLGDFVGKAMLSSWKFSQYKAGVRQFTMTFQNPLVVGYQVSSGQNGPVVSVTIAFSAVQLNYVGGI